MATFLRAAAKEVPRRTVEDGTFEQVRRIDYLRRERFENLDDFLARIVAADPARAAAVAAHRPEVEAAFRRYAEEAPDGRAILNQPMRAHILKPRR